MGIIFLGVIVIVIAAFSGASIGILGLIFFVVVIMVIGALSNKDDSILQEKIRIIIEKYEKEIKVAEEKFGIEALEFKKNYFLSKDQ
ncbi:hypothetical protein [Altericista sp. CCNU0014]|uniref:hypothetical protein n=1 Tax=Altericista sp. CCNU0014 TaxID=3082949 RepID=UPI00384CA700